MRNTSSGLVLSTKDALPAYVIVQHPVGRSTGGVAVVCLLDNAHMLQFRPAGLC
jgi:hypothetical protein